MSKVVLVGELNPYGSDPKFALYDLPERASGHRLRLILGLPRREYLALGRVNLCTGKWSMAAAKTRAHELLDEHHAVLVLLGRKVSSAFAYWFPMRTFEPFTSTPEGFDDPMLVTLPHPSGLCRAWNEPGAVERARTVLRAACPGVAWGQVDS